MTIRSRIGKEDAPSREGQLLANFKSFNWSTIERREHKVKRGNKIEPHGESEGAEAQGRPFSENVRGGEESDSIK